MQITVRDEGVGIPQEEIPYIFDRFYQVGTEKYSSLRTHTGGTGIGLTLTKKLVELLNGTIHVDSVIDEGTVFQVLIPITREAEVEELAKSHDMISPSVHIPSKLVGEQPKVAKDQDKPLVLIVEDSVDVAQYIMTCLKDDYRLQHANNGQKGIEYAIEEVPDIILSDVMMPIKDGFELCQTLKTDQRTSHIPIILLTARADEESRLKGLETGADAYLSKPFNEKELGVRMKKLHELRSKLLSRYASGDKDLPEPSSDNKFFLEDKFVKEVVDYIDDNIEDDTLGITELCTALAMSRTQLHNKIKSLTGRSTSHFIRGIRLKRAKSLLVDSSLNISEVAYAVGFSNPQYFSRSFSKEFGGPPSEFRNN